LPCPWATPRCPATMPHCRRTTPHCPPTSLRCPWATSCCPLATPRCPLATPRCPWAMLLLSWTTPRFPWITLLTSGLPPGSHCTRNGCRRLLSAELYRQIRDEELSKLGSSGRLKDAAAILDELVLSRDFLPFPQACAVSRQAYPAAGSDGEIL